jgi:hypothetical protein
MTCAMESKRNTALDVPQAEPHPLYLYPNVHGVPFALEVLVEVDGEESDGAGRDSHRVAWKMIN